MLSNDGCASCDFAPACNRKIQVGGAFVDAKTQGIHMGCYNIVSDICRGCKKFIQQECAAWIIVNGERVNTQLMECTLREAEE
jgi:predicted Fe-S protein YdhL (DUF1289 family)